MWHEFGDIRCIHLRSRTDREESLQKAQGVPFRLYVTDKQDDGKKGCYESHQAVMREALDNGYSRCLVFEDDFEPSKHYCVKKLQEVAAFLARTDWDIVYLGCFPDIWSRAQTWVSGNMFRVTATQTHAYVAQERFMKRFVALPYCGIPIDEVFVREARAFAILPSLFVQSVSPSDVSSLGFVSLLTHKHMLTDAVDLYAAFVGVPLKFVLALVFVACVALKAAANRL